MKNASAVLLIRLLLCLATLVPAPLWAAIAYVQSGENSGDASASTIAVTFGSNVTAGSLLVGCAMSDNVSPTTITGVAGSSSGAWTQAITEQVVGDTRIDMWYKPNAAGGADTVTATYSGSVPFRRLIVAEYSGAATTTPLDQTAKNIQTPAGTATDGTTSTAKTTTTDGQLITGCLVLLAGSDHTVTAGTGFTIRHDTDNDASLIWEDRIQTTAGSTAATFTNADNLNTITLMATFSATNIGGGGGGGGTVRNLMMMGVGQ